MAGTAQRSFAKGELSPRLWARADLAAYEAGLRTLRNLFVRKTGGVAKRAGTEFICQIANQSQRARLLKFQFNSRQTFVLEFGNKTVRFVTNGAQVMDPVNPAVPYQIASPYTTADLSQIKYVQSGDVVTLVHPSYPPQELKRFGTQNWTLTPIVFGPDIGTPNDIFAVSNGQGDPSAIRYVVTAISTATSEESVASVPVKPTAVPFPGPAAIYPIHLIWEPVTGAASYNVYRIDDSVNGGSYGLVGNSTTSFFADTNFAPDTTYQPPTVNTFFQAVDEYPSQVTYYQQRLIFANSNNHPNRVWASQTSNFHNFNDHSGLDGLVAVQDDDAIQFDLVGDHIDPITNLISLGRLIILTEGAEWVCDGDPNGDLTPVSINLRPVSYNGVNILPPIKTDNRILYVQALGGLVREIQSTLNFGYYTFQGADKTSFSEHLFRGYTLDEWDWQQIPDLLVWAVRSDGSLLSMTYQPEQQLEAWHRHDTLGFIESVCVVPEGDQHFVYVIAQRYINGSYRRYIERMTTTIQTPVFASLLALAATGTGPSGTPTPPPPPPPPPPSPTTLSPPTNDITTDITTTAATANWTVGNATAPVDVEIRPQGTSDSSWVATALAAGVQSFTFTGLDTNTLYEWRVRHTLTTSSGTITSDYLGPDANTRFSTQFLLLTLPAPADAPVFQNLIQDFQQGSTITWDLVTDPNVVLQRLQIAGPQSLTPTDGDFGDIGTFVPSVNQTGYTLPTTGKYWLRVRNEAPGFVNSNFSPVSGTNMTVN